MSAGGCSQPASRSGDAIDRWGALYQRARLWRRRTLRLAVAAVARGDVPAVVAALRRVQQARHWEERCRARYLCAVLQRYG